MAIRSSKADPQGKIPLCLRARPKPLDIVALEATLIAMASVQRRLSAIVHAKLAGYVRLVEDEEDATFERVSSVRAEVCRPAIEGAGGSLVHSTGDSVLAEFRSAQAAVAAAIDIQERMTRFNASAAEEQRLLFRIGVHVGEIIIDEEKHDIFGDAVNLAERIQQMAEPGGIAVSRAIREIADVVDGYAFVDGGEHRAKHVSRHVHIFRVRTGDSEPTFGGQVKTARGVLRFSAVDRNGHNFSFDLVVEDLEKQQRSAVIGRNPRQCDVVLLHPTVSRRHARLTLTADNRLQVEDLGSTNGTSIDGTRIAAGVVHWLEAGNCVRFGDIELVLHFA